MQKAYQLSTGVACYLPSEHMEGRWSVMLTTKQDFPVSNPLLSLLLHKSLSPFYLRKLLFMKAARARPNNFISDNSFPLISQCFENKR